MESQEGEAQLITSKDLLKLFGIKVKPITMFIRNGNITSLSVFHLDLYSIYASPFIPDNTMQNIYCFEAKGNYQAFKEITVWTI